MNYLVITGIEGDENDFEGLYVTEGEAMDAAIAAEDRGMFAVIYALEVAHYCTSPA
jgi:hypothetical protein